MVGWTCEPWRTRISKAQHNQENANKYPGQLKRVNWRSSILNGAKLEVMKHKILHLASVGVDLLETKFKGEAFVTDHSLCTMTALCMQHLELQHLDFPEYVTKVTLLLLPCRIPKRDLFQTSTTLHSLNLFIGRWNWIFPISWLSSIAESNIWTYWWAVFMAWQAEKHRKDAFNEPNLIGREANGTKISHSCFITASLTVHHWA